MMKAVKFSVKKGQALSVIVRNEKGVGVERQTAIVRNISADGVELILASGAMVELSLYQEEE